MGLGGGGGRGEGGAVYGWCSLEEKTALIFVYHCGKRRTGVCPERGKRVWLESFHPSHSKYSINDMNVFHVDPQYHQ